MTIEKGVVEAAERAISSTLDMRAALSDPIRLESPNNVFRAQMSPQVADLGSSVVVKNVTMTEWNRSGSAESDQFLNEWTVLDHLEASGVTPRVIAADRQSSLMVIEDFGECPTLEDLLNDPEGDDVRSTLARCGEALATVHGTGIGREAGFLDAQAARSTTSPHSDSIVDFRFERRDLFSESFDVIGVDVHPRFWESVAILEQAIHDESTFRSLVHGDAGPQNFLIRDEDVRMIDFEFGVYLNVMCDLGGARVGFPQTWETRSVSADDARIFEDAYRRVASQWIPDLEDDHRFTTNLLFGAGHWALNRWAGGWRSDFRNMMHGEDRDDGELRRSHYATLWTAFINAAAESDELGPVVSTLTSGLEILQGKWPDMKPLGPYPALAI